MEIGSRFIRRLITVAGGRRVLTGGLEGNRRGVTDIRHRITVGDSRRRVLGGLEGGRRGARVTRRRIGERAGRRAVTVDLVGIREVDVFGVGELPDSDSWFFPAVCRLAALHGRLFHWVVHG